MENFIYLDNAATTKPCAAAIKAVAETMECGFGNPSSLHRLGLMAEQRLSHCRRTVSDALGVPFSKLFFCSGGTEGNNTLINGAVSKNSRYGRHIITSLSEHSSVLEPIRALEKRGYEVTRLLPGKKGFISKEQVADALREDTVLISLMLVNNETGAVNEISGLRGMVEKKGSRALIHSDCVQAFLKVPFNALDFDLVTISSHKIHGPKGIGAVYCGAQLPPYILGGGQQGGFRSGTEPVELAAGFAAAVGAFERGGVQKLYNYARERLGQYTINSPDGGSSFILNFSVPGFKSETLLHYLEQNGIYVSSGSACSKGKKSHVLKSMGLSDEAADSAVRISFSHENTKSDIDALAAALAGAEQTLVKRRGR